MEQKKRELEDSRFIKARVQRVRASRIAEGKCIECGTEPHSPGHKLCNKCLQQKAARTKEVYYERKANGLCVRCGKPAVPGKVKCAECAKKQW